MPEPLIDIRSDHWAIVADILRRHVPDREVWAFGSRAKWNAKEYSDLDLAVIGETPLTLSVTAALADDFSESDLPFKVDVVDWETTSESFRKIIERDKVMVQAGSRSSGIVSDWREVAIGELAEIFDGPHATPPKTSDGPVFLGISNLAQGRLDLTNTKYLSEEDYIRWTRRVEPQAGDVVFSYETRLGEAALIPSGLRCCLGRRMGLLRARAGKVDERFLLYAYLGPQFQETLRSSTIHGSTVDRIPLIDMPRFSIEVPDNIDEQRAIAHILGTLDDKIDLNRRMNETLEALARALFKSWFVDFDPVRAKQPKNVGWVSPSGRNPPDKADGGLRDYAANPPYELPPHIADLFPTRLVDSELGEIPEGWEVGRVGNVGNVICGTTPPTQVSEYYGDDVPFITIPGMHGKIFATATQKRLSHAGAASQQKKMLPAGAICVSCIATPGLVVITSEPAQTNQQINTVVPSRSDETYFWFWALRSLGNKIRAGGSGGSVLTNLSTRRFAELNVLSPPSGIRSSYHLLVAPAFGRILESERESRTLAALRDTLLPKLISGELRVPEASKLISEVNT